MATVFVHVGQAGCQIGEALWAALARERPGTPDLFCEPAREGVGAPRPRAVLVDAEPKVVRALLAGHYPGFAFDPCLLACGESGRGGNFALGYAGTGAAALPAAAMSGRPELVDRALDATRCQVERCHGAHLGTVLMHSLGGGTGSGLGARLVEELRDTYPHSLLATVSVLPMSLGENPLQSLNALLALAALQELTDAILLYENDRLMALAEVLRSAARPASGASNVPAQAGDPLRGGVSLASMNTVVAQDLLPFLCPPHASTPFDLGELLATVCPMPTHRFAQAYSGDIASPQGLPTETRQLVTALTRSAPRVARTPAGGGSVLAAQVVVRGAQVPDPKKLGNELVDRLGGITPWQPFGTHLRCSPTPLQSAPGTARICMLVNWKRTGQVLGEVVAQARRKYAGRTFTHWYERYGFGPDMFAHAFEALDDIVANYDSA